MHPAAAEESPSEGLASVRGVAALELFFDLVFVFVLTQITATMAADISWSGLGQGLVMLALVWVIWSSFTWVANARSESDRHIGIWDWRRPVYVLAMFLMLLLGITVPEAFGLHDMAFAVTYLLLGLLSTAAYLYTVRGNPQMTRAVWRAAPGILILGLLLLAGAFFEEFTLEAGAVVLGLIFAYAAPLFAGNTGWRISPVHADERFSLFIIIALGESFIAIGFGAAHGAINWDVLVLLALGVTLSTTLWWQYFALVAHHGLAFLEGLAPVEQARKARILYTYIHVLMVIGVVFMALGLKKAVGAPLTALYPLISLSLMGGVALFVLALTLFRAATHEGWSGWSLIAVAVLIVLIPLGMTAPAIVTLGIVVIVMVALTLRLTWVAQTSGH